jgi:hypothetical protein
MLGKLSSLSEMRADKWTKWTSWTESTRETAGFALQPLPADTYSPVERQIGTARRSEDVHFVHYVHSVYFVHCPRALLPAPLLPQHELGDLHGVKGGSL